MRRVLVLGNGGSGKSTFAARLAEITGLPMTHLDRKFWKPGWRPTNIFEFADRLEELAAEDAWILDGNYAVIIDTRIERADTVFFLDFPVWLCILRVLWRVLAHTGRTRESMTAGCPERIDWKFLKWLWTFPRRDIPLFEYHFEHEADHLTVHRFKTQRQADAFLSELQKSTDRTAN